MSRKDKNKRTDIKYALLKECERLNLVAYMPSTSWRCPPQHQMWDLLLLVSPPLKDRRELVAKVSIGMEQCVKKHSNWIP